MKRVPVVLPESVRTLSSNQRTLEFWIPQQCVVGKQVDQRCDIPLFFQLPQCRDESLAVHDVVLHRRIRLRPGYFGPGFAPLTPGIAKQLQ